MKRRLTINYLFNLSYQLLIIILPLITTPYVSRILKPEGIGIYSYTTSITTYFILFGCIGLNLYGQREIAYHQDKIYERSKVFYELLFLKILVMSVSIIIFIITVEWMNVYKILFYIQLLDLIANMLDISYFYQGLEDFKKIVLRNLSLKIIGILCILLFVRTQDDLPLYAFIYSASLLLGNLSLWLTVKKYLVKVPIHKLKIFQHVKPTLILFFPQIAISIYTVLDRTMIGIITHNTAQIAYYEQAQKIIKLTLTVVTSLSTVMLPRIANLYINNDKSKIIAYTEKSLKYTFSISLPIMFGLIAIASNLIPWFLGNSFLDSIPILQFTSLIVVFIGISNIIGFQYLIPTKRQKIYTISTIVGSCVNLILNFFLIPHFLSLGASVASVAAECSVCAYQLYHIRKEIHFYQMIKSAMYYLASSFLMFLIIYFLSAHLSSSIMMTFLLVSFGIILYFFFLIVLKDELIFAVKKRIFNKKEC